MQTEKCKKKTDKRLSWLLSRIRLGTPSKINQSWKINKLQAKYERFDPILEQYKTVRLKDGGGIRYIDVETSLLSLLKKYMKQPHIFILTMMHLKTVLWKPK